MSAKDDGGTAFPTDNEGDGTTSGGMSLRDWFAGHVLAAFTRAYLRQEDCRGTELEVATRCYEMADAMITARGFTR